MATTYTEHLQIPKHSPTDPFDIALINEGFDKTEAGILAAYRGRAAFNLLDNSNFRNPVNQRGSTSYKGTANTYTIDRWLASTSAVEISINANGINIDNSANASANGHMNQRLKDVPDGGTYTLCASTSAGMLLRTFTLSGGVVTNLSTVNAGVAFTGVGRNSTTGILTVQIGVQPSSVITVYWAALYEGKYTAETLPTYMPKGYTAELAECQRYSRQYSTIQLPLTITTAAWAAVAIDYTGMRVTPSVTYELEGVYVGGTKYTSVESITARALPASELVVNMGTSVAANQTGTIRFKSLTLSAGL